MTPKHPEILLVPESVNNVSCTGTSRNTHDAGSALTNSAGSALGHPKVYYSFDGKDEVVCDYCDRLFTKVPQPGAKPYQNAA